MKTKKINQHLFGRLLKYAKRYTGAFVVALVIIGVGVAVELYQPIIIGKVADGLVANYNRVYAMQASGDENSVKIGDYYISSAWTRDFGEIPETSAKMFYISGKYYMGFDLTRADVKTLKAHFEENATDIAFLQENYKSAPLTAEQIKLLRSDDLSEVIKLGFIYLGTVLLLLVLNYSQAIILAGTGQKIIFNIRSDVFSHLTKLSMSFFNKNPIGRLVTRVTNDSETVNEMYTSVIVNILKSLFVLVAVMVTMMTYNLRLSLLIFTVLPLVAVFTFVFEKVAMKMYRVIRAKISELNGFVAEHVSGMKIVQIFASEGRVFEKFSQRSEELRRINMRQLMLFSLYSPTSYVLNIAAISILLWFGGASVMDGTITIGVVLIFQRYIGKLFDPIQELAEDLNVIQSANAAAERIFWLLDTKPEITNSKNAISASSFRGEIEFRHVWFAYEAEDWILKDVSFHVGAGQKVAFVGATGAGKTTIQSLICRYFDIQKGEILIDGMNIRDIKMDDLRRNIGQMLQDVFLFTGDIKSNIRLNESNISDDDLMEAAKYVNADPFITHLEHGYNESVMERGSTFSSGERQLLSFARTLAFKPSVLILDEATANIDTETEGLIQDALNKIMDGRTTIVVAHRLSTIQNADNIIVMHKGEIREQGTHQELLQAQGIYYKLYKLQYEQ